MTGPFRRAFKLGGKFCPASPAKAQGSRCSSRLEAQPQLRLAVVETPFDLALLVLLLGEFPILAIKWLPGVARLALFGQGKEPSEVPCPCLGPNLPELLLQLRHL